MIGPRGRPHDKPGFGHLQRVYMHDPDADAIFGAFVPPKQTVGLPRSQGPDEPAGQPQEVAEKAITSDITRCSRSDGSG